MEQLYLIFLIVILSTILFLTTIFLYKKNPKMSIVPIISTAILTIIIFVFALSADGWDGLIFAILGALIGVATILSSIALLIYHIIKKNQNR